MYKYDFTTKKWSLDTGLGMWTSCFFSPSSIIGTSGDITVYFNWYRGQDNLVCTTLSNYHDLGVYIPYFYKFNRDYLSLFLGRFRTNELNGDDYLGGSIKAVFRDDYTTIHVKNETLNAANDFVISNYSDDNDFYNIYYDSLFNNVWLNMSCNYTLTMTTEVYFDIYYTEQSDEIYFTTKFEYESNYTFSYSYSGGFTEFTMTEDIFGNSQDDYNIYYDSSGQSGVGSGGSNSDDSDSIFDGILSKFGSWLIGFIVPSDDYFGSLYDEVATALNEKIPYQDYLSTLDTYVDISDYDETDKINVSIDLLDYKLGNQTLSVKNFINFGIFTNFKNTWYTWVRVFMYTSLVIWDIHNVIKFIDSSSSVANGFSREISRK